MGSENLIDKLNAYPMWVELDPQGRSPVYEEISALSEVFLRADLKERTSITHALGRSAKHLMFEYTRDKAVEARRTGSKAAVIEGLIPVVMAGGRPDNPTGGFLLSILLRSAEASGLNARDLFEYAAQYATDDEAAAQIRGFPLLPPGMRGIARFGLRERRTPQGVTYEHAAESMMRSSWWGRLIGRRRVSREELFNPLRELERELEPEAKGRGSGPTLPAAPDVSTTRTVPREVLPQQPRAGTPVGAIDRGRRASFAFARWAGWAVALVVFWAVGGTRALLDPGATLGHRLGTCCVLFVWLTLGVFAGQCLARWTRRLRNR